MPGTVAEQPTLRLPPRSVSVIGQPDRSNPRHPRSQNKRNQPMTRRSGDPSRINNESLANR
ncbi:MAG: hypothetical protein CBB71_10535 [Rhodopirellula sp. TMED11]|nr:MAG: hypothetical protein CBB71_10535 [Rhodopirellula sp. TMED11]